MSRIGKKYITMPQKVKVTLEKQKISVAWPSRRSHCRADCEVCSLGGHSISIRFRAGPRGYRPTGYRQIVRYHIFNIINWSRFRVTSLSVTAVTSRWYTASYLLVVHWLPRRESGIPLGFHSLLTYQISTSDTYRLHFV